MNIFENRKCVILIQRILIIKIKESSFVKLVSFIKKNINIDKIQIFIRNKKK